MVGLPVVESWASLETWAIASQTMNDRELDLDHLLIFLRLSPRFEMISINSPVHLRDAKQL
jgi:hypothetical protein